VGVPRSSWWNNDFDVVCDVKNDLYMLERHVIEMSCQSSKYLLKLGKKLLVCKLATTMDAKQQMETLFPRQLQA
jgi:hypothetical protein